MSHLLQLRLVILLLVGLTASVAATQAAVPTTGLQVDSSSRTAVLAFWNTYYKASEGSAAVMDWNGNHQTCNAGSNSLAYTEMVERRINFYRALAGLNADTVTNSGSPLVIGSSDTYKPSASVTKQSAAQKAALMFSWANQLSHEPPNAAPFYCWSSSTWNAAYRSNLALGFSGPEAIDAYMRENDPISLVTWDGLVGHRRWILKQGATDFASGDVPGVSAQQRATNVLYVIQSSDELVEVGPQFAAWPAAGYFPDALMATQWSLSYPGASFSSATVMMTNAYGQALSTTVIDRDTNNLADPAIVWTVPSPVASTHVDGDTTYHVTVSGIQINGETVSHSYSVTVFDPDVLTESLALQGTTNPPLSGANYAFESFAGAGSFTVLASESEAVNWTAGAEEGSSDFIIDQTGTDYPLRVTTPYVHEGSRSFRLRLPAPSPDGVQSFIIDREVIPGPGATISYRRKRGYMASGELFELQTSNDGSSWVTIDSVAGHSTAVVDPSFTLHTKSLTPGLPIRVRAVLRWQSGFVYNAADNRTGIFLDSISFSNCEWATSTVQIEADQAAGMARVDSSTLGYMPNEGEQLSLRLQVSLGGTNYVSVNPLPVTFGGTIDGFEQWAEVNYPSLTGGFDGDPDGDGIPSGVEYAFGLSPIIDSRIERVLTIDDTGVKLSTPLDFQREGVVYQLERSSNLSSWTTDGTSVTLSEGNLIGSAPISPEKGFLRWRIVHP